jgi:hypothetical protein
VLQLPFQCCLICWQALAGGPAPYAGPQATLLFFRKQHGLYAAWHPLFVAQLLWMFLSPCVPRQVGLSMRLCPRSGLSVSLSVCLSVRNGAYTTL